MSNDLLRLLVLAAVAYLAYNVLVKNDLIKNEGSMVANDSFYGEDDNEQQLRAEAERQEAEEQLLSLQDEDLAPVAPKRVENRQVDDSVNTNVLPPPQMSNNHAPQGNYEPAVKHNFSQLDCFPKDQLVASDLLPPEGGFAESNPAPQGHLMNRNLFESGHHAGLNTQSSTLKNANRQLRSDPLIPRRDVGPWSQSTIEADTNRRQFEIGMM